MGIWQARKKSQHWLQNELLEENQVVLRGFELVQGTVEIWAHIGHSEDETLTGQFGRIYAIILAKAYRYLLGSYSLMLDGLGQEAGALLRPLLETYELLIYLRNDPKRVEEVINDNLPSAGIIAKRISGQFQYLRTYLNDNASHFNFHSHAIRHLFDFNQTIPIKILPAPGIHSLRTNLATLNAFQIYILIEAVNGLFAIGYDANDLADEIESYRNRAVHVFQNTT